MAFGINLKNKTTLKDSAVLQDAARTNQTSKPSEVDEEHKNFMASLVKFVTPGQKTTDEARARKRSLLQMDWSDNKKMNLQMSQSCRYVGKFNDSYKGR
mmetsp:Transcript_8267/g.12717  ORF Transcript_8267/g.12717 Transcript_8267/m.12717 type:complete len:99 (+) Transcript_8267:87-383(+)